MNRRVLWLDNDPLYIGPYVKSLEDIGDVVTVVTNVTKAEELVNENAYDLLIIDAMIPAMDDEEEIIYPPQETDRGLKMGVAFYRRLKERLARKGTAVLALTVRLDETIQKEFELAGLPIE